MKAKYLGLDLSSPVVVSSSPYTASIRNVEQCVRNGAGAVVLKSIFEEQIYRQAASLDRMEGYGDAGEYLERYLGEAYKAELLELVSDAAKTGIPVIGSINCAGAGDVWIEYAAAMQQAGASALELNIFLLPTDRRASAQEIESHYADIVRKVAAEVKIPVSVKLPMRLYERAVGRRRAAGPRCRRTGALQPFLRAGHRHREDVPGERRSVQRAERTAQCPAQHGAVRPCASAVGHCRFDRCPRRGRRGQVAALRSGGGAGLHGDPQIRLRGDRGR